MHKAPSRNGVFLYQKSNERNMKKNLGSALALYPTPAVVVGTMVGDRPNWVLVGHLGIIGHDRILVSLAKAHYTNQGIKATGQLSVNIIDDALLQRADYVGCVSGAKADKSEVFGWHASDNGTPMIDDSPLVMDCEVVDNYETETFDSFICRISATYAEEAVLTENGKIDYGKLKPILFEMPTYSYLRTGEVVGKCMTLGKELKAKR